MNAYAVEFAIAATVFVLWAYLVLGHGGFWCASERDDTDEPAEPANWPRITAVIPARNEAAMLPQSLVSLLKQDYPGEFSIILVDDNSTDETAGVALKLAADTDASRLTLINGTTLPSGWTGKLWAVEQGVAAALANPHKPDYLLLTDADIGYAPDALRRTVARAVKGGYVLTSLMARLKCDSFAERALVPAFIFFFEMLYPFAWVNTPKRSTAAAAGGSMLVEREALAKAGGIAAIRSALIDDCALGANLKRVGPIWLGLTERVESLRPYPRVEDIRKMVARSAYAQLHYSLVLLLGTVLGMTLVYLAPMLLALFGHGPPRALAACAWALMALAFVPILRFYSLSPAWALALPLIAATYMAFTVDSAIQHWLGRGGMWKGRAQAMEPFPAKWSPVRRRKGDHEMS